jgi:predicted Na+-dependent transporter
MESATWKVAFTMIVPTVLGMMCRTIIRRRVPPAERTACTNSLVRKLSVSARTSRAVTSQPSTPMTTIIIHRLGVYTVNR